MQILRNFESTPRKKSAFKSRNKTPALTMREKARRTFYSDTGDWVT